jgi:hypothetical protein
MQAIRWEKTKEAASIEVRQAGNCGSSRNRRDTTEERARPTSEAGVRLAVAKGQPLFTVMSASVSLYLRDFQVQFPLTLCIHKSLLLLPVC